MFQVFPVKNAPGIFPTVHQLRTVLSESPCVEGDGIYLIELKGANYNHALEQIDATLEKLIITPKVEMNSVHGKIVLTKGRVPGIKYSKEASLVKKLKKLNGSLDSKTRIFEEEI